jgi:hypothetical protein
MCGGKHGRELSQLPPARSRRLVVTSGLHRNSAYLCRCAALASQSDASGMSDKHPVLAQHAEPEAFIDRERFTGASASLPERHTFSWKGTEMK